MRIRTALTHLCIACLGLAPGIGPGAGLLQDLLDALFADQTAYLEVKQDFDRRQAAGSLKGAELDEYRAFVERLRGRVKNACAELEQAALRDLPEDLPCEFAAERKAAERSASAAAGASPPLPVPAQPSAATSAPAEPAGEGAAPGKAQARDQAGPGGPENAQGATAGVTRGRRGGDAETTTKRGRARVSGPRTGSENASAYSHLHIGEDAAGPAPTRAAGAVSATGRFLEGAADVDPAPGQGHEAQTPTAAPSPNAAAPQLEEGQSTGGAAAAATGTTGSRAGFGANQGHGNAAQGADAPAASALDARFEQSLSDFDGVLREAQSAVDARKPFNAGAAEDFPGGQPGSLQSADLEGAEGSGEGAGEPQPGRGGGSGSGGGTGGRLGRVSPLPAGTGPVPRQDQGIVARQLYEAAQNEPDPALRAKLWEEYRKLRGGGAYEVHPDVQ